MKSPQSEPVSVLLVEDDPADAARIEQEINRSPSFRCIARAADVEEAMRLTRQHRPGIVLHDLHLQGRFRPDGIAAIRELLPEIVVLVLSHYEDTELIFESLRHGADGYVLKSDARHPVVEALAEAISGDAPLSRSVARRILTHFRKPSVRSVGSTPALSPRQREVVDFICEGWTNKEIAGRMNISSDAVKQHIAAVKRKLRVRSRTQISGWFGRGGS